MSEWQGSPNGYGLLNEHDVHFLEQTLRQAADKFSHAIKVLEVGVACGYTARGMDLFCKCIGCSMEYHGIDGEGGAPHPGIMPNGGTFYSGDSREIFESIPNGFHVLFIDACHCNNCVMLDFLNYGPKVVSGGWVLFHDTNPSPRWVGVHSGKYAGHGPKTPAFHIAVRQAIGKLGLLDNSRTDWSFTGEHREGDGLGMMAFLKLR